MQTPNLQSSDTIIGHVRGRDGAPGRGLQIDDIVSSITDLPEASEHQNNVYGVGAEPPQTYYWSDGEQWVSIGQLNGFSPTVEITEIEGGHRVTITDIDGPQSFDVMDGVINSADGEMF